MADKTEEHFPQTFSFPVFAADRKWNEEMGSMKHKEINYLHLLQSSIKIEENIGQIRSTLSSWKH